MPPIMLTPQQRKALVKSKELIDEAEQECARAERAGIPCDEAKELVKQAREMRDGLLREYGQIA